MGYDRTRVSEGCSRFSIRKEHMNNQHPCASYHQAIEHGVQFFTGRGATYAVGPSGTEALALRALRVPGLADVLRNGCSCAPFDLLADEEIVRLAAFRTRLIREGVLPRQ
jgi:hypothetical protein